MYYTPILKHTELNIFSTSQKILAVACNSSLASKKSEQVTSTITT